ncbi:MMPL family transporter [Luteolibacter sp. Populi]|uniref:MMPL family transporter n=1 Tax=Luteolibacter sp. Populi TaxID=3230487 RepID=UPI0034659C55
MLLAAVAVAASGLSRLRFDTDILSMLPGELPEVRGLKAHHQAFAREDEAILLVEGSGDTSPSDAAQSLAKALEKDGVVKRARWQPRWEEDPQGLSELLAYLWLNGDPAATRALSESLAPGNSQAAMEKVVENLATTIEGQDLAMQAHDPFGFLGHPAVTQILSSSSEGGAAFASADGSSHLVFIDAPGEVHGYRESNEWIAKIRGTVARWEASEEGRGFKVGITGEPVFSSEIGMAMEKDLSGSIGLTLTLIGILFWWMQRRLMLLGGLVVVLCLVFAVALGIAGWMYGELSIMALSSAEILIGLATDYGLVICQEAKVAGHNRKALFSASAKPVLCGALTTAVVFLALNLGGLPGMAQLGSIVAYGLVAAGVLMIVFYLPWVAKFGVNRAPAEDEPKWLPHRRKSWMITGGLVAAALAVLAIFGAPGIVFDSNIIRPRNSSALASFERMQEKFPAGDPRQLRVVIEAPDDATMLARLAEAEKRLAQGREEGVLLESAMPQGWWPDPARQQENKGLVLALAKEGPRLLKEADEVGFSEEGSALGKQVFGFLEKAGTESNFYPQSPAAREIMRLFMDRKDSGGGLALGSLLPARDVDPDTAGYPRLRALNGDGIWLSGWSLFKPAIAGLVKDDMARMLLPMGVLLIGMMAFIFRRFRDVGFALFAMLVSTVAMLAIMRLCGLQWNFINLMATPLLLGTGIDYAIHVTLTLKRTGMCFKELWNGTGKALLFCGASNVIGFGSLIFSSSDALVSLGQVAVIGILLSMTVSIFLLPGWHARGKEGA